MAEHRKAEIHYIVINGEQHMADNAVCRYIDSLEDMLAEEQVKHQKFVESINADIYKQAERVALNLASGMSESESCLKHSLNHFTETKDGEPVFKYRDTVLSRIVLALSGKTATGNAYTK